MMDLPPVPIGTCILVDFNSDIPDNWMVLNDQILLRDNYNVLYETLQALPEMIVDGCRLRLNPNPFRRIFEREKKLNIDNTNMKLIMRVN